MSCWTRVWSRVSGVSVPAAQQVGAAVAHVREVQPPVAQQHRGQRRPHAPLVGVGRRHAEDHLVGAVHGVRQRVRGPLHVPVGLAVEAGHGLQRGLRCDLAGGVATHAVGDSEHGVAHEEVVLVALPHELVVWPYARTTSSAVN